MPAPPPGTTPSISSPSIQPFKFRPRRESVDWRRINAVDVDQVIRQLDLDVLQEHISTVTFCTLDGERCQRCHTPVDPALVKLLRLAQLTVEWLHHCQVSRTHDLHASEDRLVAAGKECEQILAQKKKQEEKLKGLRAELKQCKKIISSRTSFLTPPIVGNNKCPFCDIAFLNAAFLQNHMQRRHVDKYDIQVQPNGEGKFQLESLKTEIIYLKEQIFQQQQTLVAKTAQEKELQSMHRKLLKEMKRFKAEEFSRTDRKMEDGREMYSRHVQLEYDNKWESVLQELKGQHETEMNQLRKELGRIQLSGGKQKDRSQRPQEEMGRTLQVKEQTIKALREQIRTISSNPPTRIVEVPVRVAAPAPEPKPKRVVLDTSSVSERRPVEKKSVLIIEKKQRATISNGKRSSEINENMRPAVEQTLDEKLEKLGVKMGQAGLAKKELNSIMAKVRSERRNVVNGMPNYGRHREDLTNLMEQRLRGRRGGGSSPSELQPRAKRSVQVVQIRPRSSSLPSRATQDMSGPWVTQPAPRTRTSTMPKTSGPNTKSAAQVFTSKTPLFSSDGESDEDESDTEEEQPQKHHRYPRAKSPQPKQIQATRVQMRPRMISPVQSRRAPPAKQSSMYRRLKSRERSSVPTKTAARMTDIDIDWSEVNELQEIDPRQLQIYKDQTGKMNKTNFGQNQKINALVRKMEEQFAETSTKKPAGGVSILAERKDEVLELLNTDQEESSECVISSFEYSEPLKSPESSTST
ncbi:cilium assembly protein DZIP1-like [Genypterus blacodes]|uniref:cilium assembly protein DZIP1-like n=1 Tax=Genypterus blacodes TaxID=154954 RepID=UPI003F759AA2